MIKKEIWKYIIALIFIMLIFFIYDLIVNKKVLSVVEHENQKIDEYNFMQLEKVKEILKTKDTKEYNFENLEEFNTQFELNIKPKKGAYYLSKNNWDLEYIFWFQLFSQKFISKYAKKSRSQYSETYLKELKQNYKQSKSNFLSNIDTYNFYIYPWYKHWIWLFCGWSSDCSDDMGFNDFLWEINYQHWNR